MIKLRALFVALLLPIIATGCAVLETAGPIGTPPQGEEGVAYFLPTNYVKVTVTNRPPEAKEEGEGGQEESAAADAPELRHRIELEVLPPTPDQRQIYVAHPRHKPQRDDDVTLETTASGLLTALHIKTTDQTSEIFKKLAEIAVKVAQFTAGVPPLPAQEEGVRGVPPPRCPATLQYENEFVFDPSREKDRNIARDAVERTCSPFTFSIEPEHDDQEAHPPTPTAKPLRGIYYRRPRLYRFEASIKRDGRAVEQFAEVFETLAGGPIFSLQFESGFLVEREYDVTLDAGRLTKSQSVEPSEILAAVSLPLTILEAIGDSLGSLLQVNVKNETEGGEGAPAPVDPPAVEPNEGGSGTEPETPTE